MSYCSTLQNLILVTVVLDFNYGSTWRNGAVHFEADNNLFDHNNHANINL